VKRNPDSEPEWRAFLSPRRVERHLPTETRARVLARGQAIIATGRVSPPAPLREVPAPVRAQLPLRWVQSGVRISLAAFLALAAGAVGAVIALHARPDRFPQETEQPQPLPLLEPPVGKAAPRFRAAPPASATEQGPRIKSTGPRRVKRDAPASTTGLDLLQRAHAAYTRQEFSSTLALIAEHARQFPQGSLAEEREALRVRSLLGSGRSEEARRAAAAFAVSFPHSVLLPRIHEREKASE
jgi:hypothetical protein